MSLEPEPPEIAGLHEASSHHRKAVEAALAVGCFYCRRIFTPGTIKEWIDDDQTAICPFCGVDSVLPSPTEDTLKKMGDYWFAILPESPENG